MVSLATKFTRADYMLLPEGFPAELIDGFLVKEPSPRPWHQALVVRITQEICEILGRDRVLVSPIDLFIDDYNVLQPDVAVLPEGYRPRPADDEMPTPVVVFEVLSPSTAGRDRNIKADKYLAAGVAEVWLVDLEGRRVCVRTAQVSQRVGPGGSATSRAIPVLNLDLDALFDEDAT